MRYDRIETSEKHSFAQNGFLSALVDSGGIEPRYRPIKLFGRSVAFIAEMKSAVAIRTNGDGVLN